MFWWRNLLQQYKAWPLSSSLRGMARTRSHSRDFAPLRQVFITWLAFTTPRLCTSYEAHTADRFTQLWRAQFPFFTLVNYDLAAISAHYAPRLYYDTAWVRAQVPSLRWVKFQISFFNEFSVRCFSSPHTVLFKQCARHDLETGPRILVWGSGAT